MNGARFGLIYRNDLARTLARPIFWVFLLILLLTAWGLSSGNMTISSGNSAVGGTKAWITSEFANAKMFSMTIFLFYSFFAVILMGMAVMQDDEMKVGEIIHATPLTPREYIGGKFTAIMTALLVAMGAHILFTILFNHVVPNPKAVEIRGPLRLVNYLRPALLFGLPPLFFVSGTGYAIGERTRKPILVFVLPVAAILVSGFFLWSWTPSWLDPRINRVLMWVDPAGVRWLSETWLKVDQGVEFYNRSPISFDAAFLASRVAFLAIGLLSVVACERHFARNLRGVKVSRRGTEGPVGTQAPPETALPVEGGSIVRLAARLNPPGFLRATREVLAFELREIRSSPGLYLFVPMILLQTLGTSLTAIGAFDTPVLVTPGTFAVRSMNTVTLLVCLLSLFYTVESMRRERNTGLSSIYFATPARTASIFAGKEIANCVVGLVVVLATMLGGVIAILIQHRVGLDLRPMFVVWGLCLLPTFIVWTAFVTLVFSITVNRYTTYAVGLGALVLTGYLQAIGKMSWVGNWNLWNVLEWSDMGTFELGRSALVVNRLLALSLAVLFTVAAVRFFPRNDRDATRTLQRLAPGAIWRTVVRFLPFAIAPVVLVIALWVMVDHGFQGSAEKKRLKDYWRQNLATWKDAPAPALTHVDVDLDLDPQHRSFRTSGEYDFVNRTEGALAQIPLTGGTHWKDVAWTMNGTETRPEDRNRLYVFTPAAPLQPGDSVRIGFRFHGTYPQGATKNGGGTQEFILPSGVVLTSFRPSFVPVVGYLEDIGVDKENRYEPRVFPDDYYKGVTKPALGTGLPFTTRIRITAPEGYTLNSVGVKTVDSVRAGMRTVVWKSDEPVRFFNVVAGKWDVKASSGAALYYHPSHTYNVDEIAEALAEARRWYSEWFYPYPWRDLKISEFPALAFYAEGFPTDISFSEGIGFLTKSDPRTNLAFMVAAHETAHQWWGNLLTPGKGPGGDILAEGMAHFSTILLMNQVKGEQARIEFCKRIEERYGDNRQVDSERPLVKIDGTRTGDQTVTYDKGGWVFWMLLNRIGRDADLAGLHEFVRRWKDGPDYPLLEDFVETMRPFAPDTASYDAFVKEWFFSVVVPEYRLSGAKRAAAGTPEAAELLRLEASPGAVADSARRDGSATRDSGWIAKVHVKNAGTGRMPVEISATKGERFDKNGLPAPDYRDASETVTLGSGEETDVLIRCPFEPERITVDPDARVLQLRRKYAIARF